LSGYGFLETAVSLSTTLCEGSFDAGVNRCEPPRIVIRIFFVTGVAECCEEEVRAFARHDASLPPVYIKQAIIQPSQSHE
jgi:hypothetical protein